jgi:hypothetical protein
MKHPLWSGIVSYTPTYSVVSSTGKKNAKRSAASVALAAAATTMALAGCSGGSPIPAAVAGAGASSPAAAASASASFSAAGVAAGSDSATCQQMASAWATFASQEQKQPGSGYQALETAVYNLSNYMNLDTVTQAISNLFGDLDSMTAHFSPEPVPASPGIADPDDMTSFDSDSKVVAKVCDTSLPLPKSALVNG